ncbi:MAG: Rpn family recombination-promoting nuclease/putative transposase, partial [Oscillospiraceae bacterium]|nr:Rpn family recombination-promoting nuclease/putative transposase [Oscillospiraceae bacterium]
MIRKLFGATNDLVFKKVFGDEKNQIIIKDFLDSILDIKKEEYENIRVVDPFIKIQNYAKDKIGILDIKLKLKSGKIIDIEIQVAYKENIRERVLYYLSNMILDQMGPGEDYDKIQKVVSILIAAEHILIKENDNCHNKYLLIDKKTNSTFTNKIEINTLEILKLPKDIENDNLIMWIKFLKAKSEEDLKMVYDTKNQAIKEAV